MDHLQLLSLVTGHDAAHGQAELPGAEQPGAAVPLVGRRGHQVLSPYDNDVESDSHTHCRYPYTVILSCLVATAISTVGYLRFRLVEHYKLNLSCSCHMT